MIHYPYMLNELNFYKKNKGANNLRNSKGLGKKNIELTNYRGSHRSRNSLYL